MGISADWDRERFTLDDGLSFAVRTAFKRLYDDGLIYRGTYLVNWCSGCGSAISDEEVVYRDEPEQGSLWYIRYKIAAGPDDTDWQTGDDGDSITIATTRPETMLGDTAVAVHPDDERYRDLIGKHVLLPALGRRIPIIADEYVEREFGTGALKITPAHDPNDYEMGKRHSLPIDQYHEHRTPRSTKTAGRTPGYDRFEARRQHRGRPGGSRQSGQGASRTYLRSGAASAADTIVEPLISTQWFVQDARRWRRASPRGRARGPHQDRARALREDLHPLDGKHPRLVHQPPAVVGPSHPGVVRP